VQVEVAHPDVEELFVRPTRPLGRLTGAPLGLRSRNGRGMFFFAHGPQAADARQQLLHSSDAVFTGALATNLSIFLLCDTVRSIGVRAPDDAWCVTCRSQGLP